MITRIVKRQAEIDLDVLLDHLSDEAGSQVARKYAMAFDECLSKLSQFPGIGAPRPELGTMTRMSIVSPYLVFYDFDAGSDTVTVLRILHGRRNFTRQTLGH